MYLRSSQQVRSENNDTHTYHETKVLDCLIDTLLPYLYTLSLCAVCVLASDLLYNIYYVAMVLFNLIYVYWILDNNIYFYIQHRTIVSYRQSNLTFTKTSVLQLGIEEKEKACFLYEHKYNKLKPYQRISVS